MSNVVYLKKEEEINRPVVSCSYSDGWYPERARRNKTNLNYKADENYLNKIASLFGIKWSQQRKGCFRIETKEGKAFYYYPKTGKWRAEGKSKHYKSINLFTFFQKFAFKNYTTEQLVLLKPEYSEDEA